MEVPRRARRLIAKGAAAPGPQDQGRVTVGRGDRQNPVDTLAQQVSGPGLAQMGRIGRGAGQEAQLPGGLPRGAVVGAKHRHPGGEDGPVAAVRQGPLAVGLVHGIAEEGGVQGAGAAQPLLLGAGAVEEAAAGLDTVGEVEGQYPLTRGLEAPGRNQGGLVGDLDTGHRRLGPGRCRRGQVSGT